MCWRYLIVLHGVALQHIIYKVHIQHVQFLGKLESSLSDQETREAWWEELRGEVSIALLMCAAGGVQVSVYADEEPCEDALLLTHSRLQRVLHHTRRSLHPQRHWHGSGGESKCNSLFLGRR